MKLLKIAIRKMSPEVLDQVEDIIDVYNTTQHKDVTLDNFENEVERIYLVAPEYFKNVSQEFIITFPDKLPLRQLTYRSHLSEETLRRLIPYLNEKEKINPGEALFVWSNISMMQTLQEPFIEEFKDKLNWYYMAESQKLSEPFIEKHQDKLTVGAWDKIAQHQKLSEPFIRKHLGNLQLGVILQFQKLSDDFIREYASDDYIISHNPYLHMSLLRNPHNNIPIDVELKLFDRINAFDSNYFMDKYNIKTKEELEKIMNRKEEKEMLKNLPKDEEMEELIAKNKSWYKLAKLRYPTPS